jgi:hypothetical protein
MPNGERPVYDPTKDYQWNYDRLMEWEAMENQRLGPQTNPWGGTLGPGFPAQPTPEDFATVNWDGTPGPIDYDAYLSAMDRWYGMAAEQAEFERYGFGGVGGAGGGGPSPEQLAIERSKVHAQNMSTFVEATLGELQLQIESGRLQMDQAEAEFNRRMDAFSEGGQLMQGMWQWTVAPGTEVIHSDLRANLGMQPWESQAIEFDPLAEAWDIVQGTPEITQSTPSFDPLQEAIDLVGGFI